MIRIGVVGIGGIGQGHVRRLQRAMPDIARVTAIADVDSKRTEVLAREISGLRIFSSGLELIESQDVDAVVVATGGSTHAELVLRAISLEKPVFCEKPLAPTVTECQRILDAEIAKGRRFVWVGFNRRFDPAYQEMKKLLEMGSVGNPLLAHCAHRNPGVPVHYTGDMPITDTAVHEFDTLRWLFDQEVTAVQAFKPPRSSRARPDLIQDPLLLLLTLSSGIVADVEIFVNAYGYDVRCEVVGETGTLVINETDLVTIQSDGHRIRRVARGYEERFAVSYDNELQAWVRHLATGRNSGPNAWDGYLATLIAEACLTALRTGAEVKVDVPKQPPLYATER